MPTSSSQLNPFWTDWQLAPRGHCHPAAALSWSPGATVGRRSARRSSSIVPHSAGNDRLALRPDSVAAYPPSKQSYGDRVWHLGYGGVVIGLGWYGCRARVMGCCGCRLRLRVRVKVRVSAPQTDRSISHFTCEEYRCAQLGHLKSRRAGYPR